LELQVLARVVRVLDPLDRAIKRVVGIVVLVLSVAVVFTPIPLKATSLRHW
jgi:hypothetical protein